MQRAIVAAVLVVGLTASCGSKSTTASSGAPTTPEAATPTAGATTTITAAATTPTALATVNGSRLLAWVPLARPIFIDIDAQQKHASTDAEAGAYSAMSADCSRAETDATALQATLPTGDAQLDSLVGQFAALTHEGMQDVIDGIKTGDTASLTRAKSLVDQSHTVMDRVTAIVPNIWGP